MHEIASFNELFAEAARCGLRLNNLFQTQGGAFRCSWRLGEWCGPFAEHERPFDAALGAYALADLQAPHVEKPSNYAKEFELSLAHQDAAYGGSDLFE